MSDCKTRTSILLVLAFSAPQWLEHTAFAQSHDSRDDSALASSTQQVKKEYLSSCDLSLFLAGDAVITQPWSHITESRFQRLVSEIRAADAAIVNLEMLIHEYKGFPQAESGGTYVRARPEIASEIAWAGIDMVAHANNHTFDYGSIGVLENLENVTAAGLVLAGSGKDLQHAQAPRYFQAAQKNVALVSAASTFPSFGKASRSRPDMHGRPGLNPLSITAETFIQVTKDTAGFLGQVSKFLGYEGSRFTRDSFNLFGLKFKVGDEHSFESGQRIIKKDLEENLKAIREARETAEIVVMSLHAHHKMHEWLPRFAYKVIDAGVDVVFIHGPHRIRGIEVYKGRLIFYGMGDFVFQYELIERLPTEFYERFGLGDNATPEEAIRARTARKARASPADREAWESFAASLCFIKGQVAQVRILPLDLGFGQPLPIRGRPLYADRKLGKYIIGQLKKRSEEFGTKISYRAKENIGLLELN